MRFGREWLTLIGELPRVVDETCRNARPAVLACATPRGDRG